MEVISTVNLVYIPGVMKYLWNNDELPLRYFNPFLIHHLLVYRDLLLENNVNAFKLNPLLIRRILVDHQPKRVSQEVQDHGLFDKTI